MDPELLNAINKRKKKFGG